MLDVCAEAADPGDDRLAGLGMAAELARKSEQPQSGFEIDIGRLQRARQRHPLGLGLAVAFAELNVMAVRALL